MAGPAQVIEGAVFSTPVASRHGIFFWLLRTLVKVRYTFFLSALLLGLRRPSVITLLEWVVVSFLAILLHELGHAFAARFYRQNPHIELHAMGGSTSWTRTHQLEWHQRVIISLAGPGIGFLVGGLLYVGYALFPVQEPYLLRLARYDFLWVTFAWGTFNLLPLLPLDGGQAVCETLEHRLGSQRGRLLTRKISCVTGFFGLIAGFALNQLWAGFLCGIFAFDNLQRMRGLPGVALPR
jgi:stage IV sporulation protein FB